MLRANFIAVITLIVASSHFSSCLEREMTIHVNAKERECFYEKIGEEIKKNCSKCQ